MLPLRFALVASLAAVCLWGLFSLLDTLREPELLRSPKAVVVKGCDPIETPDAERACPQLFCQKALLDAKLVPLRSRFEVTTERQFGVRRLVAGKVDAGAAESIYFACSIENGTVIAARLVQRSEIEALAAQEGDWSL
jgi:hypothetical protein